MFQVFSFCHGQVKDSDPFKSLVRVYLKNPRTTNYKSKNVRVCYARSFRTSALPVTFFSPSEVIWSGTRLRDDRGPFRNAFAISLVRALVFRAQPLGCITWVSSKFLGGHNSQIIQVQVVMQNSSDSMENLSHVGCVWG